MPLVPFGEYRPDAAELGGSSSIALNVIPGTSGDYEPLPSPVEFSDALPSACRGATIARAPDGATHTYAATDTAIYQMSSRQWVQRGGGYTVTDRERWGFAQYKDNVIAVAWQTPAQISAISGAFVPLFTSLRKPRARHAAIVNREWLVLGNCVDDDDGENPWRVWVCARGDPRNADPNVTVGSTIEDLDAEDGEIRALFGREYATIVMTKAIWRMSYTGGDTIFRFDRVVRGRGTIAAGSVVAFDRNVFFMDEDGFYASDGVNVEPIGSGKVDASALSSFFMTDRDRISAVVYPQKSVVAWGVPTEGSNISRLYLYNWKSGRWSIADVSMTLLLNAFTQPAFSDDPSLADLNIDEYPQSEWNIDSLEFVGGMAAFGGFGVDNKLRFFSGPAMVGTVETGEIGLDDRVLIDGVRPVVTGASTVLASIGSRNDLGDQVSYGIEAGKNLAGYCGVMSQARYHRVRVRIPGGFSHAIGATMTPRPEAVC